MEKTSMRKIKDDAGRRKRDADTTLGKLKRTEAEGVSVSGRIDAVDSVVAETSDALRGAKNRVLDSVENAGRQDAAEVQAAERKALEQRDVVASIESETHAERAKAAAIQSSDSRIRGGSESAQILEAAGRDLAGVRQELGTTASRAEGQRKNSEAALRAAVQRSRR